MPSLQSVLFLLRHDSVCDYGNKLGDAAKTAEFSKCFRRQCRFYITVQHAASSDSTMMSQQENVGQRDPSSLSYVPFIKLRLYTKLVV